MIRKYNMLFFIKVGDNKKRSQVVLENPFLGLGLKSGFNGNTKKLESLKGLVLRLKRVLDEKAKD